MATTEQQASNDLKLVPSETLCNLIDMALDASFHCGEWTRDDDESFDEVDGEAKRTHQALADHVALLERFLDEAYELMPLDGTKKRAEWVQRVALSGVLRRSQVPA